MGFYLATFLTVWVDGLFGLDWLKVGQKGVFLGCDLRKLFTIRDELLTKIGIKAENIRENTFLLVILGWCEIVSIDTMLA